MYLNDVKLMGRVRDDATLKHLGNGGAILDFALVTTENFKDRKGESVERKETHRVVAFNNTAENAAPEGLLPADTEVLVEGFLRSRESGGYSITEVIARRIQTQAPPEGSPFCGVKEKAKERPASLSLAYGLVRPQRAVSLLRHIYISSGEVPRTFLKKIC